MEPKTILYRGKKYHRFPESRRRHLRVYYWSHSKWKESPKSLHRQIYEDNHEKIPKGCFIHHIDGNPFNNSIRNLKSISRGEHTKIHTNNEEFKKKAKYNLEKYARPKARLWHKSKEGREWHKKKAVKQGFGKKKSI